MRKVLLLIILLTSIMVEVYAENSSEIIIKDKNFKINDLISNELCEVDSDINLKKNGTYKIKLICNDNITEIEAVVDILENTYNELKKEYNRLLKEQDRISNKYQSLLNEVDELKTQIKSLEKENKEKEKIILENKIKIDNQENLNRQLIILNEQKIDDYKKQQEENNMKYIEELNNKEKIINDLISLNDEQNKKIIKQNASINYLEKINSDNTIKYSNELAMLNIKIDNLTTDNDKLRDRYGACNFEKDKILENINYQDKIDNKQKIIMVIVLIITFIISVSIISEIYRKM